MKTTDSQTEVQRRNGPALKNALGPYFAFGIFLAALPESLVSRLEWIRSLSGLAAPFLPKIEELSRASGYPNALWIYLALMWLAMPIAAVRTARKWTFNSRIFSLRRGDQWFLTGSIWFIALVPAYLLYSAPHASSTSLSHGGRGPALASFIVNNSIGTAIAGTAVFCMVAACIGLAAQLTIAVSRISRTPTAKGDLK